MSVGPNQWEDSPAVIDLSAVNEARKSFGTQPLDGVLGNNVLQYYSAVIDESAGKLYVLEQANVFRMPATSKCSLTTAVKDGPVSRTAVVEIPDNEPAAVSWKAGFERLKPWMTFAQVGAVLGGDLTKESMAPGYSGTLAVLQGKKRIDLVFFDGKVTAKSAQGIDGVPTAENSAVGKAGIGAERPSTVLADFLKARGYVEVPLILNRYCIFDVEVKVNGQPLFFFLDTGADNTEIDTDVAERRLKLPVAATGLRHAGTNGFQPGKSTVVEQFSVGSISSQEKPAVRDFGATNAGRKIEGIRPCDGAIGNNFLQSHGAIIDHASAKLYIRSK